MTDAALDPTRLDKLRKLGGDQLVASLIESFLAEAPARRAMLATGDPAAVGHVAHTLVAGAGQLGATALGQLAMALDEAHRLHDHAAMRKLTPELLTTYDDALAALRRYQENA